MSKWSFQQELKREEKELSKTRKGNLSKFVYDLAKVTFTGVVIGGVIQLYENPHDFGVWVMVGNGLVSTFLIEFYANKILK